MRRILCLRHKMAACEAQCRPGENLKILTGVQYQWACVILSNPAFAASGSSFLSIALLGLDIGIDRQNREFNLSQPL